MISHRNPGSKREALPRKCLHFCGVENPDNKPTGEVSLLEGKTLDIQYDWEERSRSVADDVL